MLNILRCTWIYHVFVLLFFGRRIACEVVSFGRFWHLSTFESQHRKKTELFEFLNLKAKRMSLAFTVMSMQCAPLFAHPHKVCALDLLFNWINTTCDGIVACHSRLHVAHDLISWKSPKSPYYSRQNINGCAEWREQWKRDENTHHRPHSVHAINLIRCSIPAMYPPAPKPFSSTQLVSLSAVVIIPAAFKKWKREKKKIKYCEPRKRMTTVYPL